jgi:hypothetical protein
MLDHAFLDCVAAMRSALETALLERLDDDEHFQVDILSGDTSWDTSYGLPGEDEPIAVRLDVNLEWPTWSQTALRQLNIGETPNEGPEVGVELVIRVTNLAVEPPFELVLKNAEAQGPRLGDEYVERTAINVEHASDADGTNRRTSIEITYEGSYSFTEDSLADTKALDDAFSPLGSWLASLLVRLAE